MRFIFEIHEEQISHRTFRMTDGDVPTLSRQSFDCTSPRRKKRPIRLREKYAGMLDLFLSLSFSLRFFLSFSLSLARARAIDNRL